MIIRTYSCLNRRCQGQFDSEGDHPPCPYCRGLRVQWVPRGFGIKSDRTTQIDKTSRELAADFGLTNMRSPQAGQAAIGTPRSENFKTRNVFEPQPGWRITLPDSALTGTGHAVCAPTGVTAKVKVDPNGGPLKESNPQMSMARMRAATRIEGSHRGK
jgi:hypothetical protein